MDVSTTRLIEALILPPGGPLLLGLVGLLMVRISWGRRLLALSIILLFILCLPVTADLLYRSLESEPVLTSERIVSDRPQAIVVLGGGRDLNAPEYSGDTVSMRSLVRLRYAAKLSRETGLPIIPSAGNPGAIGEAGAVIARDLLQNEYHVPVLAIERRSNTTWENARYTAQLMKQHDIERIILVTDAGHMTRSLYAFRRNGIKPTPAPTNFLSVVTQEVSPIERYLPSARALNQSSDALHEFIGLLWYRLK
ncbi:MAG: YdcF family protein [Candidatus Thiodiazotropha sp.]